MIRLAAVLIFAFAIPALAAASIDSGLAALSIAAAGGSPHASADLSPAGSSPPQVQVTADVQSAIAASALENTANPEAAPAEMGVVVPPEERAAAGAIVPLVLGAASSTDDVFVTEEEERAKPVVIPGPASLEVVDADIIEDDAIKPDVVGTLPAIVPLSVLAIAEVPKAPEKRSAAVEFTGRRIPTKQQLLTSDGRVIDEKIIDEMPGLGADDNGSTALTGVCGDAYYAVLLYKKADEYTQDPNSYVMNRVYECNGPYSYPLADLPRSLPNGAYYLLIGEQGTEREGDLWLPITPLMEIIINR